MLTPAQIELYNPANAKNLTPEELAVLPGLDNDELKQLATRYPAQANGQAYLVLHEAGAKTQIGKVSTYPALHSLRTRHLLKQYSIATFGVLQSKTTTSTASVKPGIVPGKIQDLTDKEVLDAPGLVRGQVKELVETTGKENAGGENTGGIELAPETGGTVEAPKLKNHREVIAAIKVAKTIDEIDALIVGDTRKSVTDAAAAAKAELA